MILAFYLGLGLAFTSLLLKDLPVWGVVQDGRVFAAADLPTD